jgi:hypothetical protein
MRSDLVFTAADRVNNPFLLCHLVRISSRRFHKAGDAISDTINRVLGAVTENDCADFPAKSAKSAA